MEVDALCKQFAEVFPGNPTPSVCRAPGRVNLIGEHTDYNGLPVLPIAIGEEIRIAFIPRSDHLIALDNVSPDFPAVDFENKSHIPPAQGGVWHNYCRAAIQGLNQALGVHSFPGMNLLLCSTLPMASGLSSSSALVVAFALAYLHRLGYVLERDISRLALAELLAEAEHYVGTRGGGMDQAAILNGEMGHACKIDFFPLRVECAPLPSDCVIMVCDSMVKVKKSGDALVRYNAGPLACALACALVEKQVQEEYSDEITLTRLGDLWFGPLCLTFSEVRTLFEAAVPEEHVSLGWITKRLQLSEAEVRERWLRDFPEPETGFALAARLRHQLTEFQRVEAARDALQMGEAATFGALMNASHQSCAQDFAISSPELDALVQAAHEGGALGARLTGAGFGGATVNLVPATEVETFVETVTVQYYRQYRGYDGTPPIFVAHAHAGAGYLQ